MRTLLTLLVLALLVSLAPARAEQPPGRLTFDDLFDDERTGRRPAREAWRPDGGALTYVWDAGEGEALWSLDPATGEATRLVNAADLPSPDREGEDGVDEDTGSEDADDGGARWPGAYYWSPTGAGMVIESGGDLLWLPVTGGTAGPAVRLTDTEADEEAPAISPDGRRLAYVREADLYVVGLPVGGAAAESEERRLTTDGEPGRIYNATTDWVYWEEIWGRDATGFWWSPDSSSIAYYRFDDTEVGEYVLLPSYDDPYPEPLRQRYPKTGTTNPEVKLGVMDLASGETTWLDLASSDQETYIARVHWVDGHGTGDGRADIPPRVAVERLNREQTELDLLLCDGGDECRVILEERHPTWINLGNETRFLPGGRLVWASEREGWRHLYLYELSEDGPARLLHPLTEGAWAVASVDHAGDDGRILATAYGTGPLGAARRRLISIDASTESGAEGGGVHELTDADGWHEGLPSPDGRHLLHGWSSADEPGWQRVEPVATGGGLGRATAELPSVPPAYDPRSLPSWHFFEMPAGEGSEGMLPAAMLLPSGVAAIDPERAGARTGNGAGRHPVIMYHYGGPGSQVVADRWARGRGLWHKLMAQRGYGVLTVDNRASVFFGKAGEDRVHRRFGEVNLEAQTAGVRYLDTLPWADASRVGLWGWSGGGSNTLYCMLRSPGTWRAGMSGAPVTDWRYYDTIWTERYLDSPEDNPEGYRDSSAVTHAEALADRLLIVHGTADDNVHPQNTMALAKLWTEAGIPFEMAIYPGEKHGLGDAASRHFFERMTGFFERALAADR
jgi:dipeptidyl-peptidase 4